MYRTFMNQMRQYYFLQIEKERTIQKAFTEQ